MSGIIKPHTEKRDKKGMHGVGIQQRTTCNLARNRTDDETEQVATSKKQNKNTVSTS